MKFPRIVFGETEMEKTYRAGLNAAKAAVDDIRSQRDMTEGKLFDVSVEMGKLAKDFASIKEANAYSLSMLQDKASELSSINAKLTAQESELWSLRRQLDAKRAACLRTVTVTPKQVSAGLQVEETHPLWKSVMAKLDESIEFSVNQASAPNVAEHHGRMAYSAGGIEHLRNLRETLESSRAEAMKVEDGEVDEDK